MPCTEDGVGGKKNFVRVGSIPRIFSKKPSLNSFALCYNLCVCIRGNKILVYPPELCIFFAFSLVNGPTPSAKQDNGWNAKCLSAGPL